MNLAIVGEFIKELRKERNLTQEDLADKFYVSRRTVSRWETGSNLPDIDLLMELADFFNVDIREILEGKRKDINMEQETKETVIMVNEYNKEKFKRTKIITLVFLMIGIIALLIGFIFEFIDLNSDFLQGFIRGISYGTSLAVILLAILYITGIFDRFARFKQGK